MAQGNGRALQEHMEPAGSFEAMMADAGVQGLWGRYHELVTAEPKAIDRAFIWRWNDLLPLIDRAASEVRVEDAERRVLMLVNDAFGGKVMSTTNLFAGIQILEPGERARAHRHTASALRFVIEGSAGSTIVDGKLCPMQRGDLILTPNWTWHEHHNDGKDRVLWLDVLDLPLSGGMDTVFAEGGIPNAYPDTAAMVPDDAFATGGLVPAGVEDGHRGYSPMFRYPWAQTVDAFSAMPKAADGSRRLRYTDPATGGPVMSTIDCYGWELAAGHETRPYRTTSNAVCMVVEGEGTSHIGSDRISWRPNDVFSIPHWNWVTHTAVGGPARLFVATDREVLRKLHLLRDEMQN